jgi:FkbM family methyltransferase
MLSALDHFNFENLNAIHIGASWGQERQWYYKNILWIEANPACEEQLRENLKSFPNQTYKIAVCSDKSQPKQFNIASTKGASSSLLPLKKHKFYYPDIEYVDSIPVQTVTLDDIVKESYDFLNIDVQGAELLVLKGATALLPQLTYIYAEINKEELYAGCGLLPEIDSYLENLGFCRILTSNIIHGYGEALYQRVPSIL